MKLFAFNFNGPAHLSSGLWRHPLDRGHEYKTLSYWLEYAKMLENACFDGIFFADNIGYHDVYKGSVAGALKDAAQIPANDPAYLIPAMAAVTQHLGFGITSSTAYDHPYQIARKFATLDHLTGGRIGWNVVTSYVESAARNIGNGAALPPHAERYARAEEFIEVMLKLLEGSWEDGSARADKASGVYIDPDLVHEIKHEGKHFTVPGIFLCEPSPQRTPVIFQAGGSSHGVAMAAASAEAVFLNSVSKAGLKKQVDTLREKAVALGRNPAHLATVQLLTVIVAATDAEAQERYAHYQSMVDYEGAMARYSSWAGLDMSTFDPDVPLKHVQTKAGQLMVDMFTKMDPDIEWTPRKIADYLGVGGTGPVIVGGPSKVAEELQSWVDDTGISGFNIAHGVEFEDMKNVVKYAVPELQNRGLMRTAYEGNTLRENLFGKGRARLPDDHPGAAYRNAFKG